MALTSTKINNIYKKGKTFVHDGIMQEWAKFTDNNSYIHSINEIDMSTDETLIKNLLEIFKYSLKFQDLSHEDLSEVYTKTYKKRLLGGFGSLYGIKVETDLKEEELNEEYLEIIYRFNFNTRKYFHYSQKFFSSPVRGVGAKGEEEKEKPRHNLTRHNLIKKPLPKKHLKIEVLSKDGEVIQEYKKTNPRAFSDFELFKRTMTLPPKAPPRRV